MSELSDLDGRWLDVAARWATPALGTSGPGPTVGALVVDEKRQQVFGRAATPPGGQSSAEAMALAEVRDLARGRTLYLTMEPASRGGRKPPVDQIIESGVGRVVIGMRDPDRTRAGDGLHKLAASGIKVVHGPHPASSRLNEGYVSRLKRKRPFVTVAMVLSADGRTGYANKGNPSPAGAAARRWIERQRAASDAVLAGMARATIENNDLAVHLEGFEGRAPLRILAAGTGPIDAGLDFFTKVTGYPTAVVAAKGRELAVRAGVEIIAVADRRGRADLRELLGLLAARGINRLFVEAGARLVESFIGGELVDRLEIIDVDKTLGPAGTPAALLGSFADRMAAARLVEVDRRALGEDKVRTFQRG